MSHPRDIRIIADIVVWVGYVAAILTAVATAARNYANSIKGGES